MQDTLKKVWALFTPAEQRKALGMLALIILMALAETAGVVSIMPFLSALGRPEIVHETPWLKKLYDLSGVHSTRGFLVALGLVSITIVITSTLYPREG